MVAQGLQSRQLTFSLNNAISAGRYKVVKNGPVCIEIWAWGFLTDDANDAADPHLFCEYYCTAYSDPSNSVNVLYFKHSPKISQPMLNPTDTSVNVVIGSASLYDGVTKLRDLTDDAVTLGPSDVFIGGSGVPTANFTQANTTRILQTGVWYRVHVQPSCTPPGGMTDGMLVMTDTSVSDKGSLNLYTKPHVGFGYNTPYSVQPRSVGLQSGVASGHNSLKLTPQQACCYYMGFYITANDNGDPILTPGRWANPTRFLPNLDGTTHDTSINSQKAYWQATGLVPPWDITLSANCASMDGAYWGFGQGPFYRPFSNGPMRTGIDGGGDDWNTDGPWAEWDARWFMRMGATNWSPTDHVPGWVAGLCNAHMGQTQFLRQSSATSPPYIVAWDNGPNNAGASYPGLGAACPSDAWLSVNPSGPGLVNTDSGFVIPPGAAAPPPGSWAYGPWSRFSNYHWPPNGILQFLIFGERCMLDEVRRSANRCLLQQESAAGRNYTSDPPYNFYGVLSQMVADGEVFTLAIAAGYFGNASDPEAAYFQNMVDNNFRYVDYLWGIGRGGGSYAPASEIALGWTNGPGMSVGFNSVYNVFAYTWGRSVTRHPKSRPACDIAATYEAGWWDDLGTGLGTWGVSIYYGGGSYRRGLSAQTSSALTSCSPGNYGFIGLPMVDDHITLNTNGIFDYSTSGFRYGPGLKNGDVVYAVGSGTTWWNGGSTYDGVPEFGPPSGFSNGAKFYVCQLNTSTRTFRLTPTVNDPRGANAITNVPSGPYRVDQTYFCFRPTQDTAGTYFNGSLDGLANNNEGLLRRAALAELVRVGAAPNKTYSPNLLRAYSVCNSRTKPVNTFTTDLQSATAGARLSQVTTVAIYPPIAA